MKLGKSFTVFVLFFGLALIKAFIDREWPEAIIFAALGVMSLWADSHDKKIK